MTIEEKREREFVIKDFKREIEYYKQKELLAAVFFDGEHRETLNYYKKKRKEAEEMLKAIEEYRPD